MRAPDLTNENGNQAWLTRRSRPEWSACVALWYIKLKNYHPMLEWFVVSMSHLREIEGTPKANKNESSSTHEIVIAAVDPEIYLMKDLDPDDESIWKLQLPLEVTHQFNNLDDAPAKLVTALVIQEILNSRTKPDREERVRWMRLFNDINLKFTRIKGTAL